MGMFDNVQEKAIKAHQEAIKDVNLLLVEGETIEAVEKSIIDYICFTNKRIFVVDKSYGSKKAIFAFAYKNITEVGLIKGGTFSFGKELIIRVGSHNHEIDFYDTHQTAKVFKLISEKTLSL